MNLNERRELAAEIAAQLQDELGDNMNNHTRPRYRRNGGYCAYCCVDLLQKYSPAYAKDHVLPKGQGGYPDYADDLRNLTFSCAACNDFKGEFDPVDEGEDEEQMLEHCHAELIERSRVHVCLQRTESELSWRATARQIIRG